MKLKVSFKFSFDIKWPLFNVNFGSVVDWLALVSQWIIYYLAVNS